VLINFFIKWEKITPAFKKEEIFYSKKKAVFLTIFSILIFIYIYVSNNDPSVFFSTRDVAFYVTNNQKNIYYFLILPKAMVSGLSIYLIYLLKSYKTKFFIIYLFLLIVLNFIICYPSSTPRLFVASFYLGMTLILVDYNKLKTRILFMIFMPIAYYTLLTYLSGTTRSYDKTNFDVFSMLSFNFFGTLDFDTFWTSTLAIQYVNENLPNFGLSLISALLVVIPRSVWISKAASSGDIFGEYFNLPFTSISCNLVCESYLNFGIFGIFIFFFILKYLNSSLSKIKNSNFFIFYIIINSYFMFIYRGSLGAPLSFLTPMFILIYIIIKLSKIRKV